MGKRDKYLDYLTTALLILVPSILFFQKELIQSVPPEYTAATTIILGFISQIFTNGRVDSVKAKYKQIETWTVNDIDVLYGFLQKDIIKKDQFDRIKDRLLGL